MITDQSIDGFLSDLASPKPTPGGGSAAALSGAMGAALISMVANLTIGKKGYESVESEMRNQLKEAEQLRNQFIELISEDIHSFNQLMAAYKLPKNSDQEKTERAAMIQAGLKGATNAPLSIAREAYKGLLLAQRSAQFGNKMVISDAGVAVEMLLAALKSAGLNVYINVPSISDQTYRDIALNEIESLTSKAKLLAQDVYSQVKTTLAG
ncbi:MAG: cyclodeaminase/cyclohydrolase family protein [Betaproteobacteria bacterium]|nr:cyclodeaminase/cyclohydrolase family protein [Betaproteobacteria bacterium]